MVDSHRDLPPPNPRDDDELTSASGFYAYGEVIGRGGMGEVLLAHDKRIGRDVAIKRLRAARPSDDELARFLREARIQARLDHPAIVPVYEVSRDEQGRPFFSMKRVSGATLGDLLESPASPRPRLLRAFADVCRAIDFAHARGVVHRDLKPSNVVLGEFGDVYVLDWGVARVVDDALAEVVTADTDTLEGAAPAGQVLGTPGYMAPEQLHTAEVDRAADIYALGAIAFELLAGEPLHPRGHQAAISSTLAEGERSPARRRPDRAVPPELDALCSAMLARDPNTRPTARRVAERIEAYLDGDRDVARRRTLAVDLVWSARAALDDDRRAEAMRAAGRALALDPEVPGAAELLTTLMLEPPREPPEDLTRALRASDVEVVRRRARAGVFAYLAIAAFLPILMWNGIRKWDIVLAVFGFALAMAIAALQLRRRPDRSFAEMVGYALGNAVLLGLLGRLAGPFTFVPALACFMVMSIMSYPAFVERPWALIATIVAGFVCPLALEAAGLLPETWTTMQNGGLVSHTGALELGSSSSAVMVVMSTVSTIVVGGAYSAVVARANRRAQQQLLTQAWQLRQLLPDGARRG
ncbi:MAG: serine/threonine-protein kinase [Kofleriaceae bacterium]